MRTRSFEAGELMAPVFMPVHRDIWRHGHTHYLLEGGRGSGKSSFVALELLMLLLAQPNLHGLVLRKVGATLRNTVYSQYLWAAHKLGVAEAFEARLEPLGLTRRETGQRLLFLSGADREKIKSIKMPFGYIGLTHFEEKDQFDGREEIRGILQSTMRGGDVFWNFETNNPPPLARHWANRDSLEERGDRLVHKSDYRAVPRHWLGEAFFAEAERLKERDPQAYAHEYLGRAVGSRGAVFENVEARRISCEEMEGFSTSYMGIDWGYYPDPFAWNRVYYDAAREVVYVVDELTCRRLGNEETARLLAKEKGVGEGELLVADSAEQKSIADYVRMGFLCKAARKGQGSVSHGMKWLQARRRIVIDPVRCPDTCREFLEYEYARDRDGEVLPGFPDRNNHHIDAVRYAFSLVI